MKMKGKLLVKVRDINSRLHASSHHNNHEQLTPGLVLDPIHVLHGLGVGRHPQHIAVHVHCKVGDQPEQKQGDAEQHDEGQGRPRQPDN